MWIYPPFNMIKLAMRGGYVILCCVMKGVTDNGYQPEPRVRAMVRALVLVCLGLVLAVVGYGTYLLNTAPAVQEDSMPLDPEETVLFYQPEEYCELAPLAEVPAELDYLNHTHYLV